MASSFTRSDSPYFWLRLKAADGSWTKVNSQIRIDDPDGARKLKMRLAKEGVKEVVMPKFAGSRFEVWVPAFLKNHYSHPLSFQRAMNAWAAVSVYLERRELLVPSQINHRHGHDYVNWRQAPDGGVKARSKNTALLEVKVLSVIMHEAVKMGWISGNPLLRLGIKRTPPKEKLEITAEAAIEIEAALEAEPQWMRDAWLIATRQGCRLRATAVPMELVDEAAKTIVFRNKGGRLYGAPLHKDLLALVKRRRQEKAALLVEIPKAPSKSWHTFFKKLGMAGVSFHSTRVTVITRFARANVSISQAMSYVGHSSEIVHRIYQKLQPPDVSHLGDLLG